MKILWGLFGIAVIALIVIAIVTINIARHYFEDYR
jgi:hypothetical protein